MPFTIIFLKYANLLSDDILHVINQILIKDDEERYLGHFCQTCLILCNKSVLNLLHNTINSFTMATYWVPDLSNIKHLSGHLWHCILIFGNDAPYA